MRSHAVGLVVCLALSSSGCVEERDAAVEPAGSETSTKTQVLKAGAQVIQPTDPPDALDIYLVGFHPMKADPHHQMEAHHFCQQVNEDFAQCALWDGNTDGANLNGIEYIISERLYESLPDEEKQYWHPHNYEILSGQLIAPGLPDVASRELMQGKMNSYGKTWHVWSSRPFKGEGTKLPLGEPKLAWSFNADGEAHPGMVEDRDRRMDLDTAETRRERAELRSLAHPQQGVNAISDAFPSRVQPPFIKAK